MLLGFFTYKAGVVSKQFVDLVGAAARGTQEGPSAKGGKFTKPGNVRVVCKISSHKTNLSFVLEAYRSSSHAPLYLIR